MWLTIIALVLGLLSACTCVFLFIDISQRPRSSELRDLLERQSESVLKQYLTQFRALETEWDDMYQKFSRLAGRMDRQKALSAPAPIQESVSEVPQTRADLLRRYKSK